MKIDLPILVIFDCQETTSWAIDRAAGKMVCTLRYDTEGDGTDALLIHGAPSNKPVEEKYQESGQAILAHISGETDKKITARAARSPYDYLVGTEQERNIAQEEADEARAANGQFGAGS